MEKLNEVNINKPELAYKFYKERWRGNLHYIDWARFSALNKLYKGGKYLDAGCFNSPMPLEMKLDRKTKDNEIIAIDYCKELIDELKTKYPEVDYRVMDVNKLEFEDSYFDYVVAGELIEHMEQPQETLKELIRVIKVGGVLALSTPLNEIQRGNVSDEHLWSFSSQDFIEMLAPYGKVHIEYFMDTVPLLMVYFTKK